MEGKRKHERFQVGVPATKTTVTSITTLLVSFLVLWFSMPYIAAYAAIASDWILSLTLGRLVNPDGYLFGGFFVLLSSVGILACFGVVVAVARRCYRATGASDP
jgi:hypothetical protein